MSEFELFTPKIMVRAVEEFGDEHLRELKSFINSIPDSIIRKTLHKSGGFRTDFLMRMPLDLFRQWLKNRVEDPKTAPTLFDKVLTQFFNERYRVEQADFFKKTGMPANGHLLDSKGNWNEMDWSKCGKAAAKFSKAYPNFPLDSFLVILAAFFQRTAGHPEWTRLLLEHTGLVDKLRKWHDEDETAESELREDMHDSGYPAYDALKAEDSTGEWETVLDRIIRKLVKASAEREFGSLPLEEIADLVDEVIHLNSDRTESVYHSGYLEAMTGVRLIEPGEIRNAGAARFYTLGLIGGYIESGLAEKLSEVYDGRRENVADLLANPHIAAQFARDLEASLQRRDRWQDAAAVLEAVAPFLEIGELAARLEKFSPKIAEFAESAGNRHGIDLWLAVGKTLNIAEAKIESMGGGKEAKSALGKMRRCAANCYMAAGNFREAKDLLSTAAQELEAGCASAAERAAALVDLVLAKAGFANEMEIHSHAIRRKGGLKTLAAETEALISASRMSPAEAGRAKYLLGAAHYYCSEFPGAAKEFEEAISLFSASSNCPRTELLIAPAHHLLAKSLFQTEVPANADKIAASYKIAIAAGIDVDWKDALPLLNDLYLLGRAGSACEILLGVSNLNPLPQKPGKEFLEVLGALAAESPEVWQLLEKVLNQPGVGYKAKFEIYLDILKGNIALSESAVAAFIETVDSIVIEHPVLFPDWIDFLLAEDGLHSLTALDLQSLAFERAWDCGDYSRLFKAADKGLLQRLISVAERSHDPGDAEEIEEWLDKLSLAEESEALVQSARKRLEILRSKIELADSPDSDTLKSLLSGRERISILVIGGDEKQAQYETKCREEIEKELGEAFSKLNLKFYFTCWNNNFGRQYENMKGELSNSDVVVVHRLIRTILGRKLRKYVNENGKKWVGCIGRGGDSLTRSILLAIDLVLRD